MYIVHECVQGSGLTARAPTRRVACACTSAADDGKHASSVIEVESSLLEAKLEGGLEGDVLGVLWEGCGFTALGLIRSTKILLFFIYILF